MGGFGILYYSTNKDSKDVDFENALFLGQAPDKGLYLPKEIPKFTKEEIDSFKDLKYHEIAYIVIKKFLKEEIDDKTLKELTKDAYNYDVPLEKVTEKDYVMRLDQGPTASFKDFAARMMARLMQHYMKKRKKSLIILTATSGDTGSAVAQAFYGLNNIDVVVLFPKDEVSSRQRKQMTTLGKNIKALSVSGKFDDCQAMVKQAFSDNQLKYLNLSSANSINFGRLLPQTVYYFYAYSRLANGKKIIFSVPSGNFGDMMGGVIAKKMGLPIKKFVVAVNENKEFAEFYNTGKYQKIEPSKNCISNAMNVGHPSNLARLFAIYGGQMDEKGQIKAMPDMNAMKKDIIAFSISDEETKKTIKEAYKKHKLILEPHGAVGFAGLEKYRKTSNDNTTLSVCLETAHPAKFPEYIKLLLNLDVEVPQSLKKIDNLKESMTNIDAKYDELKEFLQTTYKVSN